MSDPVRRLRSTLIIATITLILTTSWIPIITLIEASFSILSLSSSSSPSSSPSISSSSAVFENSDLGDLELYKIAWKGPLTSSETFDDENVINISTQSNNRYKCIVPNHNDQLNFDSSAKNSSSEENKSPIQVLEPLLQSNYCSYKIELFWVYELCHGKFLRQYHEETTKFKSKITQEYYLGKIEPEQIKKHIEEYEKEKEELDRNGLSRPTILVNGHYKPYVMLNMTSGTKCDLTKKDRVARIIYVCGEDLKLELYSLKEISTCEYEAIVLSPLLCLHKDFKVDTSTQHEIKCYSLDGSPRHPTKSIEEDDEEENNEEFKGGANSRRRGIAYFQGRTLIIDADLKLS